MARKNSKQSRYDGMTQWQQKKIDRRYTRRNDAADWTTKLFKKIKETDSNAN